MMDIIAAWLPFVVVVSLFLGIGLWISKHQMRRYGEHVDQVNAVNDELKAINREMLAELREIKEILKDRN